MTVRQRARIRSGSLIALVLALVVGLFGASATARAQDEMTYPELTITLQDFSFDAPDQAEAGYTLITQVNEGQEVHHTQFAKLNEGVTMDDLTAAFPQGEGAIMGLLTFVGGPGPVEPGGSSQVILNLEPGTYALLCFVAGDDGVPHLAKGMVKALEVTAGAATPGAMAEPEAAGEIILRDFSFEMPDTIPTGQQIYKVTNEGPQPHEIGILKLAPGVTVDMLMGMLMAEESAATPGAAMDMGTPAAGMDMGATPEMAPSGPPPVTAMGGMQALATGLSGWLVLNLEEGDYVAVCFIPDPATGQPHVALGMIQAFHVGGESMGTPSA